MTKEVREKLLNQLIFLQCIGDFNGFEEETMHFSSLSDEKLIYYQKQLNLKPIKK